MILLLANIVLSLSVMQLFGHIPKTQAFFDDTYQVHVLHVQGFTVEGWYDIPEQMAAMGAGDGLVAAMKLYFVFAVLVGCIVGLSIASAAFVDEMTSDNTDEVEKEVRELRTSVRL